MMRGRQVIVALAVVAAVQAIAAVVYRYVEDGRVEKAAPFVFERLAGVERAPELLLEKFDGSPLTLVPRGKVRLVHFWATWCGPCVAELPGLLELRSAVGSEDFDVIAVSVDDDWESVAGFFSGDIPAAVLRARVPEAYRAYGVDELPDSFLVSSSGKLVIRFGGARDWRSSEAIESVRREIDATGRDDKRVR